MSAEDKRPGPDGFRETRDRPILGWIVKPSFRARARRWFCGEQLTVYVHKKREPDVPRAKPFCCVAFDPARPMLFVHMRVRDK